MLIIFEPIKDSDLDHQAERDRIREMFHRPLNASIWGLGSDRDWVVVDTACYEHSLTTPFPVDVCIAFVAPVEARVSARGEWSVNKLLTDYSSAYRYLYLDSAGNPLRTGWRVGGEVELGRLKSYKVEGEALIPIESDWVATQAYTYEPNDEGCYYRKTVLIECELSPVLVAA
jgi:hypothetical protein